MVEKCKNDHVRTEENTSWVKASDKKAGIRRRCLDCRREAPLNGRGNLKGGPSRAEMSRMATTYLHEDLEDLLSYGSTYNEIMERSGFHDWSTMLRSLKSRNRQDLIDAIREKRALV